MRSISMSNDFERMIFAEESIKTAIFAKSCTEPDAKIRKLGEKQERAVKESAVPRERRKIASLH